MMGDGSGRHPARPVDDDQVPRLRLVGHRSPTRAPLPPSSGSLTTVNTLSKLYPNTATSLYPAASHNASGRHAAAGPVHQRRSDHGGFADRSREIPAIEREVTDLLRERHHLPSWAPDDFKVRDMTEMTKALTSTTTLMTSCCCASR